MSSAGLRERSCLIGYAHHKVVHDPEHPLVKKALAVAKNLVADLEAGRGATIAETQLYDVRLCPVIRRC